jgi:thioesterase domain-containing protein/acyl carrier protein
MIPAAFVTLERLPLSPNGKIDRRALPAPDQKRADSDRTFVAPRDSIEHQLLQIWQELLPNSLFGINDNFFELGGHSLLAVRLMSRMQERFGIKVQMQTLFQAATIENLASVLRAQSPSIAWSPLVKIYSGGDKLPFYCVHPLVGMVFCYYSLLPYLNNSQHPFYGLQAAGLYDDQRPFNTIEEMASCYLKAVRESQPNGPYLLGGWSLGGLIAFEMAQQLIKQGEQVALLAIIDTPAPNLLDGPLPQSDDVVLMAEMATGLFHIEVSADELRNFGSEAERLNHLLIVGKNNNCISKDLTVEDAQKMYQVLKSSRQAMRNYTAEVYPDKITLLRAETVMTQWPENYRSAVQEAESLGWHRLSAQPIEVETIPGNHRTMMDEPNVKILAARLNYYLELLTK